MTAPWHEGLAEGQVTPLAFIKLDLEDSTELEPRYGQEKARRIVAAYRRVVEGAMATIDALPRTPNCWSGEGAAFVLGGERPVAVAVEAAKGILRDVRVAVEVEVHVRIAVGFDDLPFDPRAATLDTQEVNFAGHLESVCPRDSVLVTEQAHFEIRRERELANEFAYYGMRRDDRCPAYVSPKHRTRTEAKNAQLLVPLAEDSHAERQRLLALYDEPSFRQVRFVGVRQFERVGGVELVDVYRPLNVRSRGRWTWAPLSAGFPWAPVRLVATPMAASRLTAYALESHHFLSASDATPELLAAVIRRSQRIIVLGDPGCGKSTLLRYVAIAATAGPRSLHRAIGIRERTLPLHFSVGRLAPLVVDARNDEPIATLASYYRGLGAGETRHAIEESLTDGSALLLFDGLDEVPAHQDRRLVERFIEGLCSRHAACRAIVTSRVVGYVPVSLGDGETVALEPLDEEAAGALARSFYTAYYRVEYGRGDEDRAEAKGASEAMSLVTALAARPALRHFLENPLLLTLAALVHSQLGRLPRYRARLYQVAAQTLIEAWAAARLAVPALKPPRPIDFESEGLAVFPALALELHLNRPGGLIPEEALLELISERIPRIGALAELERKLAARDLLERVTVGGSILLERGPRSWGFLHQTLQEYLAAKALAGDDELRDRTWTKHLYDPRFDEIWRLVAGEMGIVQERPPAAAKFVASILDDDDAIYAAALHKNVLLAAACLGDTPLTDAVVVNQVVDRIVAAATDPESWVPRETSWALLEQLAPLPEAEAIAAALVQRTRHENDGVRYLAVNALHALHARGVEGVLIELLRDPSERVASTSAYALGSMGAVTAIPALLAEAQGGDKAPTLAESIRALVRLGAREALPLFERLLGSAQGHEAATALSKLDATSTLLRAAHAGSVAEQHDALQEINWAAYPEEAPFLRQLLADATDSGVRSAAAWALPQAAGADAVPDLLRLANDERDEWVRMTAIRALRFMGGPIVTRALIEMLSGDSPGAWASASVALGELGVQEAAPQIRAIMQRDGQIPQVLGAAATALGHLKYAPAVDDLARLARTSDGYVRGMAFKALGRIHAKQAVPVLLSLLDQEPRLAAGALGEIADPSTMPHLLARLETAEKPEVVAALADAIASIGGSDAKAALPRLLACKQALSHNGADIAWRLALIPPYRSERAPREQPSRKRPPARPRARNTAAKASSRRTR